VGTKFVETISKIDKDLVFETTKVGNDLFVLMTGPAPHLGGVSLAQPYKKEMRESITSTVSSLGRYGHQDQELTAFCARQIAKSLNCTVIVAGGLHIEQLSKEGLKNIWTAAKKIIKNIIKNFE
jgi:hypothetical protein